MTAQGTSAPPVIALLPAWNAEKFILPVLESLAKQTYPNFRVLISDDASTDRTPEVCAAFIANHPNFQVIRQSQNLGWINNLNFLMREARPGAEYLLFAFHDDILLEDYVTRLTGLLERFPNAILAYSDIEMTTDGRSERIVYSAMEELDGRVARARCMLWQVGNWWAPTRGVFRAWAAAEIGGIRTNLAGDFGADWSWLVHMSLLGEFVRAPEALCRKFHRQAGVSRGWTPGPLPQLAVALACVGEIWRSRLRLGEKFLLSLTVVVRCIKTAIRRCFALVRPVR